MEWGLSMSRSKCNLYKTKILEGSMLVIDPSSGGTSRKGEQSNAGWAEFKNGKLKASGIIELDHGKYKEDRLRAISDCLRSEFKANYDLMVIENIEGYGAAKTLIQACGAFICSTNGRLIEMNVKTWQAIANRLGGWVKGDEADAIYIGWACVAFALGYNQKESEEQREEFLKEVRKLM